MADRNSGINRTNSAMTQRGRGKRGPARFAPVEKPKRIRETLRRLGSYFFQEKKALCTVFGFVLLDSIISLLIPYFIGLAINQIGVRAGAVHFSMLIQLLLVLAVFYLADGLLTFIQGWLMASAGQRMVVALRGSLFEKLQKLPISFFDRHNHGEIMSRLTNDIENIDVTISQSTVQLMNDVIMIAGSLVMMIWISPSLTLASLIMVPLVIILTKTIAVRTSKLFVEQQKELGTLNGHIEESISGLSVIKAFSHEQKEIERFTQMNQRLTDVGMHAQIWSGYLMPLMNVINNLGFAAVASVGGFLAVKKMITIGMIASFLTYSRQFSRPLNDVASIFNTLLSAIAGAERVFDIMEQKEEVPDQINARPISSKTCKGDIDFYNVSFGYSPKRMIVKQVSFHARAGETIALVGPTGAGKTTLVNLLTRFYEPNFGSIRVDGIPITNYRRADYRSLFGMVLQDTYLFHGSFKDNLRYGRLDATDEEIKRAAIAAHADSFIMATEHGYGTMLQGSGENLSEGQKQLLTIARAVLSNPAILIMDEATSHVDTQTEHEIQEGMRQLMSGRTSIIIAHRLSTIRHADLILVVEDGMIAEQGRHEELLEKKGIYFSMYSDQFSV
ncbi:ABC transporter ATP-binding protein/permease [Sporolactobacillus shoreicorticis]|uniref:ABC transporter ATP-binding protein n=1 Tax=Sporolactobacillus shoreicorticis TaxID=1923877 RepID=A0ABW5S7Y7_9BACL|nr:ABC transporter ATP-binding protein [Sporolactobacillus shoreicorticis]MCO7125722.1 ABC transporter ATP-binding protein/permease [Sporolactobacillus shoreicorticis]